MKQTILMVHRRPRSLRRARDLLERSGYRVEVARNPAGAIETFRRTRPALALVDDGLPGGRATRLCRMLRDESNGDCPPILVMTSSPETLDGNGACDGYLLAPLANRELLSAVRRFLPDGERAKAPAPEEDTAPAGRPPKSVTGDLQHLSIAEIVQTLNLGTKTACVTVESGDREGRIWFEGGAARHARTGELEGEKAFYEMMRWEAGEFAIQYGVRCDDGSLAQDTMYLVMEGLRRIDESEGADREDSIPEEQDRDCRETSASTSSIATTAAGDDTPTTGAGYAQVLLTPRMREELAEVIAAVSQPPGEESRTAREPSGVEPIDDGDAPASTEVDGRAPRAAPGRGESWVWGVMATGLILAALALYLAAPGWLLPSETQASGAAVDDGPALSAGPARLTHPLSPARSPEVATSANRVGPAGAPAQADGAKPAVQEETLPPTAGPAEPGGTMDEATTAADRANDEAVVADAEADSARATGPAAADTAAGEASPEPVIDLSASIAAADAVLSRIAPVETEPAVVVEPAQLELTGTSSVRSGRITLLVDGEEVYSRELSTEKRGLTRPRETFETRVAVEAGTRTVVARLDLTDESYSYESSVEIDLQPGEVRALELLAGKNRRRPLLVKSR
jgi:CheY-like chemotaxis protein